MTGWRYYDPSGVRLVVGGVEVQGVDARETEIATSECTTSTSYTVTMAMQTDGGALEALRVLKPREPWRCTLTTDDGTVHELDGQPVVDSIREGYRRRLKRERKRLYRRRKRARRSARGWS